MKRFLFFILVLMIGQFPAQSKEFSAEQNISRKNTNFREAEKFGKWFPASEISNLELMKNNALKAINSAKKNNDEKALAKGYFDLAISNILSDNNEEALKDLEISEQKWLQEKQKDPETKNNLIKVYEGKGIVYYEQNNYFESLRCYLKALEICEETGNEKEISKVQTAIGEIYETINDDEKALKYFVQAYEIQKKTNDSEIAKTCLHIGNIHLGNNQFQNAKKYFDESFLMFRKNPGLTGLGELYKSIAQYYKTLKNTEQAKAYLQKAETELKKNNNEEGLAEAWLLLANIYFSENNLNLSENYANQSLELSQKLDLPETEMNSEKVLYEIFTRKGDQLNALIHLRNYDIGKERFQKIENAKERAKAEMEFADEREILRKKEIANRNKLILGFGVLLVIAALAGFFMHYRNAQERKTILLQKQLAEYEHKALHLQMNPHFLFNCLAAISSFIIQNGKEEAVKYLSKFSKLMRLTLEFSEESLIPIDKEILSLQNYLELEQLRFKKKFDFKITKAPEIEDDTAIPSLLLQPYVENAIIHGVAPKDEDGMISVAFSQENDTLICEIEDNGIGIETSRKMKKDSVKGHKSMAMEISRKRIETMEKLDKKKVPLSITEMKNKNGETKGTKVTLRFPLEYIQD